MKLSGGLFNVVSRFPADGGCDFRIHLDSTHFIYAAHFPGEPVTPGVCILQIAVELLSEAIGRTVELVSVKNAKFLRVISPEENPDLDVAVRNVIAEDGQVKAQVSISEGETVFAKLSLLCR